MVRIMLGMNQGDGDEWVRVGPRSHPDHARHQGPLHLGKVLRRSLVRPGLTRVGDLSQSGRGYTHTHTHIGRLIAWRSAAFYDRHKGLIRGLRLEREPCRRRRYGHPHRSWEAPMILAWGQTWFRPHRTQGGLDRRSLRPQPPACVCVHWRPHACAQVLSPASGGSTIATSYPGGSIAGRWAANSKAPSCAQVDESAPGPCAFHAPLGRAADSTLP